MTTQHASRLKVASLTDTLPPMVLCADDDDAVRLLCTTVLARAGFRTDTAQDGWEALRRIAENDYAAVLLDFDMPSVREATVLESLARTRPGFLARFVILTLLPESAVADLKGSLGAILHKPIRNEALVAAVRQCCNPDPGERIFDHTCPN